MARGAPPSERLANAGALAIAAVAFLVAVFAREVDRSACRTAEASCDAPIAGEPSHFRVVEAIAHHESVSRTGVFAAKSISG
jgi:hypothetical protein